MIKTLSKPFKSFFQLEAASGLVLLIAAIIAAISKTNPLAASSWKNHLKGFDSVLIIESN